LRRYRSSSGTFFNPSSSIKTKF
jgi:hypothetical protein